MGRRNFSQNTLAKPLGMTQQALSRRLTGQVSFTIEELAAVAQTLGCRLSTLTGGDDETAEVAS